MKRLALMLAGTVLAGAVATGCGPATYRPANPAPVPHRPSPPPSATGTGVNLSKTPAPPAGQAKPSTPARNGGR
ncbi:hypothetical protein F7Q99_36735 [Streptomyces kaniharaensis]|uniref:Murein L,D-transpeptidase n=1 Tax=Streptomyces kaniharaensis TaxID=212423 RepID=A0A6N7L4L0_9ACTN|nr:hypothetical protein [Streptomyces kaniharaensis]MQS17588.1 hypothetical protein [Streptomyces kaniharaensis]